MRQVKDLVPKNKSDFSGMKELNMLSDEEIESILMELLEWTQDMNWPVADSIAVLMSNHPKVSIPYIIQILQQQDDNEWKNYIIWGLLPFFEEEWLLMFKHSLERIVNEPTVGEIGAETNIEARDFFTGKRVDVDSAIGEKVFLVA